MRSVLLSLMIAFVMVSCGKPKMNDPKEVLAVVDGDKIRLGDIETKYGDLERQLFKLDENAYRYKEMYLNDMIENKLIEMEAKKRGVKVGDLINQEVKTKITPVKDEEIKAFAKERNLPADQVEKFKDRIRQYLESQRESTIRKSFAQSLKAKYKVVIKMKKPKQRSKMDIQVSSDDPTRGGKNAKVTVVEFSDFQCPFCKRAANNGNMILKEYGDKVKFVFKNFPLSFHENAHRAAEAALCMNEQGKFFEYHDKLFENNGALSEPDLKKYAADLGADMKKFEPCLSSGKYKAKVDKDMMDGQKYGVTGAPSYFINGVIMVGAVPYEEIKQEIDDDLNN